MSNKKKNLTIAYIRDELRNNRYCGNLFDAVEFMLEEYDYLLNEYRKVKKPAEFEVKRND